MAQLCRYEHAKIMLMVLDATMQIVWGEKHFGFCSACHNFRQTYCIREKEKYCINCGTFLIKKNGWVQSVQQVKNKPQTRSKKVKNVTEQQRKTILNLLAESPATIFDIAPLLNRTVETAYRYCSTLEKEGLIESYRCNRATPLTYCLKGQKPKLIKIHGLTTWDKIINTLTKCDRPLTTTEIAEKTGMNQTTIRAMAAKMHKKGAIAAWVKQSRYHAKYYALTPYQSIQN
jgi:DNA-binding MarR family transcriptional regulator